MYLQKQPIFKEPLDHIPGFVQFLPRIHEQQEIIHITDITRDAELFFQVVIQLVQVEIGKVLAGHVPDGNPLALRTSWWMTVDNGLQEPDEVLVLDEAVQQPTQHLLIQRGKEGGDVGFEKEQMAPGKVLGPLHGLVRALARPAGIGIKHEAAFQNRFQGPAEGMMDHPVPERGRGNQPFFGIMDLKGPVGSRTVGALAKFLL